MMLNSGKDWTLFVLSMLEFAKMVDALIGGRHITLIGNYQKVQNRDGN